MPEVHSSEPWVRAFFSSRTPAHKLSHWFDRRAQARDPEDNTGGEGGGCNRGAVMKVRLHPVNLPSALSLCPCPPAHSIRCFPRHPAPCFTVLPAGSTSNTENKTADPFSELSERLGDTDQQKREAREMDKINFSLGNAVQSPSALGSQAEDVSVLTQPRAQSSPDSAHQQTPCSDLWVLGAP